MLLTSVDEVVDLVFCHSCPLGGAQGALLLLTPGVDEVGVFRVAGIISQSGVNIGVRERGRTCVSGHLAG